LVLGSDESDVGEPEFVGRTDAMVLLGVALDVKAVEDDIDEGDSEVG
jgi:hypothetical protein